MIALLLIVCLAGLIHGYSYLWDKATAGKIHLTMHTNGDVLTDGDVAEVWMVLENTSWMPIPWLEVCQPLPDGLWVQVGEEWRTEILYNTYLLPRQRVQRLFHVRVVRGLHKFETAECKSGDGIGLRDRQEEMYMDVSLIVRPQIVADFRLPVRLVELVGERNVLRWYQEDASRLQGIRAYQLGDPYKHIHWAATARVGELMVKQFETTSETDFYIALNFQLFDAYWFGTNRALLDEECRFAATLAYQAAEEGYAYGLFSNASWAGKGGLKVPLASSMSQLDLMMDGIGGMLHWASGPFIEVLREMRGHLHGRATIAIITAMWNAEIAEQVEHLRSDGHHLLLLVDEQLADKLVDLSPTVTVVPLTFARGETEWQAEAEVGA